MTDILLSKDEGEVITLTLNDAPANTLSMEMMSSISIEIDHINASEKSKVVVVESSSEKIWCSGHSFYEVNEMIKNNDKSSQEKLFEECSKMLMKIRSSNKIFVAKVSGRQYVAAGGLGLLGIMDSAFASKDTRFALSGINFNFGCHQPNVSVSRTMPSKSNLELLLTGQPFNAERAQEVGLINECVENESLDQRIGLFCSQVCNHTSDVIAMTKNSLYKQKQMSIEDAYNFTTKVMIDNLQLDETKKGVASFFDKS